MAILFDVCEAYQSNYPVILKDVNKDLDKEESIIKETRIFDLLNNSISRMYEVCNVEFEINSGYDIDSDNGLTLIIECEETTPVYRFDGYQAGLDAVCAAIEGNYRVEIINTEDESVILETRISDIRMKESSQNFDTVSIEVAEAEDNTSNNECDSIVLKVRVERREEVLVCL